MALQNPFDRPLATEAEAEAGLTDLKAMSPLKTAAAIAGLTGDESGAAAIVALGNHEAATGTAVHGLGTAATAAVGDFDAAGSAAAVREAAYEEIIQGVRAAITSRRYDAIVTVSTTIGAALAAITDNASSKRYMLYVPDGTYTEEFTGKPYVDIVGESQDGVIIESSSGTDDTVNLSGLNMMLANCTVRHTFDTDDTGVFQYPIHIDGTPDGATPSNSSTTILYRVASESLGTDAKSGIGIGLNAKQRLYIVDCEASSTQLPGIFAHNASSQSSSIELYIINTTATGAAYGLHWSNQGSGQTDRIGIFGGVFSGGTADIVTLNNGGAGEAYIYIDENVTATTISLIDPDKRLSAPFAVSVPVPSQRLYNEYTGSVTTDPSGISIESGGVVKSLRTDGILYLRNSDDSMSWILASNIMYPNAPMKIALNQTTLDSISSPLADYLRFTCGNVTIQQLNKTAGTSFYLPAYPNAAGSTDLGKANLGWKRLYIDHTNTATVGNVTIDKAAGRVNIAAGTSTITVTNSLCVANSHVFANVSQADATAYVKNVIPADGSFIINLVANATADCSVDFFIVSV